MVIALLAIKANGLQAVSLGLGFDSFGDGRFTQCFNEVRQQG